MGGLGDGTYRWDQGPQLPTSPLRDRTGQTGDLTGTQLRLGFLILAPGAACYHRTGVLPRSFPASSSSSSLLMEGHCGIANPYERRRIAAGDASQMLPYT